RRAAKSFPLQEKLFLLRAWDMIRRNAVRLNGVLSEEKNAFRFRSQSLPQFDNRIPFFLDYLRKMLEERERCYLFFSNPGVRQKMSVLLRQHRIPHTLAETPCVMPPDGAAVLLQGNLIRGFRFPQERITFFSEREVLTEERVLVSRRHVRPFVSDFRDLKVNDYVVHSDFGVGVFKGLVKMAVDEEDREFIEIHYQDEDKLFVPTENLNLVQKYTSFGAAVPQVHKLGSPSWARAKARAKKAIERMARDLLHLYAQRKAAQGHRFSPGGTWQQEFEQMFEFEETEDQLQAIKDIYGDMESPSPMDRLLCGDVGYGKTEVAVRAAFKAVMDGKQVAVLCPTTVLASQHLETFRKRMMLFPVRVESLSRLQSRACQKKILQDLQKGLVDIVIGTHRLLSKDVEFRDLGLLIVDEEQRFGVAHKEKIKHLKAHIDVLTMTATPIPRTLNLSLSGLRDISLIETPPRDRLSVHTVVTTFQPKLIGSAIAKELAREGQVYFVHNRIEDIEEMAQAIQRWVPHARVAVIHGRMATRILEQRMIDFIQQKYDVLVSTSIIENGIDIPRVNTLIVDRAHTFGLAQLYQLRGRVGRSARQAFAYFLIPPFAELGRLSKERLKALQEFTELGSGFRLAAKDLEIRGAGNFLGAEQHGHMDALGFDYYMHLLNQTVREIKGEAAVEVKSEIQMRMDIRIPEEYLPQQSLRLQLYKRVSSIESLDELETIRKDIQDRFGPAPVSVEKLLGYGAIKFLAQRCGIRTVDRLGKRLIIQFFEHSGVDPGRIQAVFRRFHGSLTPQGVMRVVLSSEEETDLMVETISILKELSGI
ncbi:MAG: transcription-repair coupling factor, partial [Candidatus Aminicenantales bacterium]